MGKAPAKTTTTTFIKALLSREPVVPIDANLKRRIVRSLQNLLKTDAMQGAAAVGELLDRIQQLQDENKILRSHAMIDPLTGAYNTRYLNQLMDEIAGNGHTLQRQPTQKHFIMIIDLDKFKQINDMYGHACGDQALSQVVQKLKDMTRKSDIVCRVGGDEFVLILKNSTFDGAQKKFTEIISAFQVMDIDYNGIKIPVRVSTGWAEIEPDAFAKDILKKVDVKMYEDKRSKQVMPSAETAGIHPAMNHQ